MFRRAAGESAVRDLLRFLERGFELPRAHAGERAPRRGAQPLGRTFGPTLRRRERAHRAQRLACLEPGFGLAQPQRAPAGSLAAEITQRFAPLSRGRGRIPLGLERLGGARGELDGFLPPARSGVQARGACEFPGAARRKIRRCERRSVQFLRALAAEPAAHPVAQRGGHAPARRLPPGDARAQDFLDGQRAFRRR